MKTAFIKQGFTLVEIMIVVVIIGLLASLTIPAFKKVRNAAIEKTMLNDAKQLTVGAHQIFSENAATTQIYFSQLVGQNRFLQSLSPGNFVEAGLVASPTGTANGSGPVLTAGGYFTVENISYNTTLSTNKTIANTLYCPAAGYKGLCFQVDTGKLQSQLLSDATGQLN